MHQDSDEPTHRRALADIDLEEVAMALSNSEGGLYNPADNEVYLFAMGELLTGDDDERDPDEEGWMPIPSDDSRDAYRDMEDFVAAVSDPVMSDRLTRALEGRGAFRRFRNTVFEHDVLGPLWNRFLDARVESRALDWLVGNELVDEAEAADGLKRRADAADAALTDAAAWADRP